MRKVIVMFYYGLKCLCKNIWILQRGQNHTYRLMQMAHRIEKGMTIRTPKPMWGWEKANELVSLLNSINEDTASNQQSVKIAVSVLYKFIEYKMRFEEEKKLVVELQGKLEKYIGLYDEDKSLGGTISLSRSDIMCDENNVKKLFNGRHSCRDFSQESVNMEKLTEAIKLAQMCPTACNRQPYKLYVIDKEVRSQLTKENLYNADKYLIITCCIDAYELYELNDGIVSCSIFAAYLSLALHAMGIGSCIIRKELIREDTYCNGLKDLLRLNETEQIVLEIAIGNYKDIFNVPVSAKFAVEEIMKVVS